MEPVRIGHNVIGADHPPLLIAGPCVIESEDETLRLAEHLAGLPQVRNYTFVFKASYAKDNRSSHKSYRGPGLDEGLAVLARVKDAVGCPVLSDVHTPEEVPAAAEVLDVVQIPAFLSRQTSLLEAAARHARAINIKKGQFLSPEGATLAVDKVREAEHTQRKTKLAGTIRFGDRLKHVPLPDGRRRRGPGRPRRSMQSTCPTRAGPK